MKKCTICELLNQEPRKSEGSSTMYGHDGNNIKLNLCRAHGVEYFKFGQRRFMQKYYPRFNPHIQEHKKIVNVVYSYLYESPSSSSS